MALWDDCTECWDFDNDATAQKDAAHDLTSVNTPGYSSSSPPQGTYFANLTAANDEHFTLSDDTDFDISVGTDYSITFWINLPSGYHYHDIAAKSGDGDGWQIKKIWVTDHYEMQLRHDDNWSIDSANIWNSNGLSGWYHVIISYSTSSGNATVWVSSKSGSFGDTVNGSTFSLSIEPDVNSATLCIGGISATSTHDGGLDEFAFFNGKAISSTEAESIYNGTWRAGGTTRQFAANITAISSTSDIALTLAGIVTFAASIAGVSTTSDVSLSVARILAGAVNAATDAAAIALAVARSLAAAPTGQSSTADIVLSAARRFNAEIDAQSLTSAIDLVIAVLGLIVNPTIRSLTVQRSLKSKTPQRRIKGV